MPDQHSAPFPQTRTPRELWQEGAQGGRDYAEQMVALLRSDEIDRAAALRVDPAGPTSPPVIYPITETRKTAVLILPTSAVL